MKLLSSRNALVLSAETQLLPRSNYTSSMASLLFPTIGNSRRRLPLLRYSDSLLQTIENASNSTCNICNANVLASNSYITNCYRRIVAETIVEIISEAGAAESVVMEASEVSPKSTCNLLQIFVSQLKGITTPL